MSQGHIASTHEEVQGGSKMATLWRMHHFSLQVNNYIILFVGNDYLWLLLLFKRVELLKLVLNHIHYQIVQKYHWSFRTLFLST